MKIVINKSYGGWHPSTAFYKAYDIPYEIIWGMPCPCEKISRTDKRLIEFIEKYGSQQASYKFSNLVIVDIPLGTHYRIQEYDSFEYIEYRDEIKWEVAV